MDDVSMVNIQEEWLQPPGQKQKEKRLPLLLFGHQETAEDLKGPLKPTYSMQISTVKCSDIFCFFWLLPQLACIISVLPSLSLSKIILVQASLSDRLWESRVTN